MHNGIYFLKKIESHNDTGQETVLTPHLVQVWERSVRAVLSALYIWNYYITISDTFKKIFCLLQNSHWPGWIAWEALKKESMGDEAPMSNMGSVPAENTENTPLKHCAG